MLTVYAYRGCDTCRKALKWLNERGVGHQVKAIRETPPSADELRTALATTGGDLRPLFNTSGADYREMGLKEKLPGMTTEEAITLLAANGNLVKRPFVIGEGIALTGFKEEAWSKTLLP